MYKVAEFRKRLKECMELAENGQEVVIGCYGKRFKLVFLFGAKEQEQEPIVKAPISKDVQSLLTKYGCGCDKVEGKMLCGKHKRY